MNTNWIVNADGSIYHLRLKSGDLATTIITVGDPDRVIKIGHYLDHVETNIQSREFRTITGYLSGKRISVLSTGIGTDNIDIVMNEVDALFNIDLSTGLVKENLHALNFIRLGTSGAIQTDIPIDSLLITQWSIGMDGLLPFYAAEHNGIDLPDNLVKELPGISKCFMFKCDEKLLRHFQTTETITGITLTASGFYAPQGRLTRIKHFDLLSKIKNWDINNGGRITNLEMETSAIYGLSNLMGHRALSISAILANRITGEFSTDPDRSVHKLIEFALERISGLDD
jgi:uridine phosphorylase